MYIIALANSNDKNELPLVTTFHLRLSQVWAFNIMLSPTSETDLELNLEIFVA